MFPLPCHFCSSSTVCPKGCSMLVMQDRMKATILSLISWQTSKGSWSLDTWAEQTKPSRKWVHACYTATVRKPESEVNAANSVTAVCKPNALTCSQGSSPIPACSSGTGLSMFSLSEWDWSRLVEQTLKIKHVFKIWCSQMVMLGTIIITIHNVAEVPKLTSQYQAYWSDLLAARLSIQRLGLLPDGWSFGIGRIKHKINLEMFKMLNVFTL